MAKRLGAAGGAKRSGLNRIELPPNEEGAPPHCHSADEEIFVVLDGEGTLELWGPPKPGEPPPTDPQERHAVKRGHVVSRPAGTRTSHCLRAGDAGSRTSPTARKTQMMSATTRGRTRSSGADWA